MTIYIDSLEHNITVPPPKLVPLGVNGEAGNEPFDSQQRADRVINNRRARSGSGD